MKHALRLLPLTAVLALLAAPAAARETPRWSFAIHGGAGVIERDSLSPEQDAAYRAALHRALEAGSTVLANGGAADQFHLTVEVTEKLGADTLVHGRVGNELLTARLPGTSGVANGDTLSLATTADRLHLFDRDSGKRL